MSETILAVNLIADRIIEISKRVKDEDDSMMLYAIAHHLKTLEGAREAEIAELTRQRDDFRRNYDDWKQRAEAREAELAELTREKEVDETERLISSNPAKKKNTTQVEKGGAK